MHNISPLNLLLICTAFIKAFFVLFHISSGLCSTHPFFGKYCLNSICDLKTDLPLVLNKIALLEVVPWSKVKINFFSID